MWAGAKLFTCALVSSQLHYAIPLFRVYCRHWPHQTSTCSELNGPCCVSHLLLLAGVPLLRSLHWLPVKFRIKFKACLLIYKTLHENRLFKFTQCLPHHSDPIDWSHWLIPLIDPIDWSQTKQSLCRSLELRPMLVQELFTLVPLLFGTTACYLSIQPLQLQPSRSV